LKEDTIFFISIAVQISSSFNHCSFIFLNQDYTEEDEEDELKVFLFYRGGVHAIAFRLSASSLRCSFARSQALPGNVYPGGSATYEMNRGQSRQA